ncbi:MAG: choice-of-anchor Q domain-containing protein [Coleofasciculus sp. B1-GNL1-01]|uniref:choice-of-anchor Q domain-containing protein n=1 Tax=Coleofasciculus sp. B1-GNL1-01 TaxID=3068484 RepID=UPI003302C10C
MATFTVTNLFDSGAGSFRQAIFDANTQAGTDEIVFDTGGFPSTLTLTSGELNITDSVNILGSGADFMTVSGNNNSRIFSIDDGGSQILDVLISGLTVSDSNGKGRADPGGAIYNEDENLTLLDLVVTNNTIKDFGVGGGIFNSSGKLTLTNSIISHNRTFGVTYSGVGLSNGEGGGIYNGSGIVNIHNSTISHNKASGASGRHSFSSGNGGGIFNRSGELVVTDSTISDNTAVGGGGAFYADSPGNGGGIFNDSGMVKVENSTISGNRAFGGSGVQFISSGPGKGGGIFNRSGELVVTNSTVNSNMAVGGRSVTATNGQAANGYGGGLSGKVTLSNSTISGNIASGGLGYQANGGNGYGGGLWGWGTVTNSTITGNAAKGGDSYSFNSGTGIGSGIFNTETMTITSSIIAGNTDAADISGNSFTSGGHNLIGNGDGTPGFINGVNNDQVGTTDNPIDPLLGLLQNNGGSTATHALLPGSPAIDAGSNPLMLLTDQRGDGFNRTVGSQTDVGAFEVQPSSGTSVPEPSSMLGLLGLLILGTTSLLKRKRQQH